MPVNPAQRQRTAVGDSDMPAGAEDQTGSVGAGGIQLAARRIAALVGEEVVVPSAPADERLIRVCGGEIAHGVQHVRKAVRVLLQLRLTERAAQIQQVQVGIVEAWADEAPAQVDALRARISRVRVLRAADEGKASVLADDKALGSLHAAGEDACVFIAGDHGKTSVQNA